MSLLKIGVQCVSCGVVTHEEKLSDLPFISNNKCWKCVFAECSNCNGQGFTGWVSPDGDFDFDYCECNPLNLTLSEIR